MSCVHPITAYRGPAGSVVFDINKSTTRVGFNLPCGRCIGCRMEKARQWGIRCLHEAKLWPCNAYVTLTYDPEFIPPGGSLVLRDVQLFMKRLRKVRKSTTDNPIRFFLGGEYGETNLRPHYHALLFNCDFPDKRPFTKGGDGSTLYTSDELASLWGLGHCTIGAVTLESAVYCAKYALKKVTGNLADDHYTVYDADGVVYERKPEFAVMSLRPGIGAGYFEKFGSEYMIHDNVVVNAKPVKAPRYYDILSERVVECVSRETFSSVLCHCILCRNKRKRKVAAVLARPDNTPERLDVKERLMIASAKEKERKL